jgi:hypothetical protein
VTKKHGDVPEYPWLFGYTQASREGGIIFEEGVEVHGCF